MIETDRVALLLREHWRELSVAHAHEPYCLCHRIALVCLRRDPGFDLSRFLSLCLPPEDCLKCDGSADAHLRHRR